MKMNLQFFGGRGSSGGKGSGGAKTMPWSQAYVQYRAEIESASELTINPENGHAVFSALEAPITPVISNFLGGVKGTDSQLKDYYKSLYPKKSVEIRRSKYI